MGISGIQHPRIANPAGLCARVGAAAAAAAMPKGTSQKRQEDEPRLAVYFRAGLPRLAQDPSTRASLLFAASSQTNTDVRPKQTTLLSARIPFVSTCRVSLCRSACANGSQHAVYQSGLSRSNQMVAGGCQ
ncbi:hypothetical protein MTO96_005753 [Rhipicephalus appendiculatus]